MSPAKERIEIRAIETDDLEPVLEMQNCRMFLRYTNLEARTEEQVARMLHHMIECNRAPDWRGRFRTIVLRESNTPIGIVQAKRSGARSAELGVEIDSRYWNRGLATDAARMMMAYCFETLGLHRVEAWCCADNRGAARSLQKLGMRHEGRLRSNRQVQGVWTDSLLFGILEEEWSGIQEEANHCRRSGH